MTWYGRYVIRCFAPWKHHPIPLHRTTRSWFSMTAIPLQNIICLSYRDGMSVSSRLSACVTMRDDPSAESVKTLKPSDASMGTCKCVQYRITTPSNHPLILVARMAEIGHDLLDELGVPPGSRRYALLHSQHCDRIHSHNSGSDSTYRHLTLSTIYICTSKGCHISRCGEGSNTPTGRVGTPRRKGSAGSSK